MPMPPALLSIPQIGSGAEIEFNGRIVQVGTALGQGSFGSVYKVMIKGDKTPYAMKVLAERNERDGVHYDREIENLTSVSDAAGQSHNLLRYYSQFRLHLADITVRCVLTELLGPSLWDIVTKKRSSVTFSQTVIIASELLDAVAYLHSIGLVHTDIKSANVLTAPSKHKLFSVKLADMGNTLSIRRLQKLAGANSVQAVAYRAPEVYLGMPLTPSIDIWSIGCLLVEVYTGYILFPAQDIYHLSRYQYSLVGVPEDAWESSEYPKYFTVVHSEQTSFCMIPWTSKQLVQMGQNPITDMREMHLKCFRDLLRYRNTAEPVHPKEGLFLGLVEWLLDANAFRRPTAFRALHHPLFQ